MSFHRQLLAVVVVMIPGVMAADEPKLEDLLGSWELIGEAAGIPERFTIRFPQNGQLLILANSKQETKIFELGYQLNEKILEWKINDTIDTTELTQLTTDELI